MSEELRRLVDEAVDSVERPLTTEEAIRLLKRTSCEGCEWYITEGTCGRCLEASELGAVKSVHTESR